jgi:hypothetical protein
VASQIIIEFGTEQNLSLSLSVKTQNNFRPSLLILIYLSLSLSHTHIHTITQHIYYRTYTLNSHKITHTPTHIDTLTHTHTHFCIINISLFHSSLLLFVIHNNTKSLSISHTYYILSLFYCSFDSSKSILKITLNLSNLKQKKRELEIMFKFETSPDTFPIPIALCTRTHVLLHLQCLLHPNSFKMFRLEFYA